MKRLFIIVAIAAIAVIGLFATGCDAASPPAAAAVKAKVAVPHVVELAKFDASFGDQATVCRETPLLASNEHRSRDRDQFKAPQLKLSQDNTPALQWRPPPSYLLTHPGMSNNRAREKV
jgi:hypothetical protein